MSWAKIPTASEHFGVSARTLRKLLRDGLPHSRLPSGTILIELEAGDDWLRGFNVCNEDQQIINDVLSGITST